MPDSSNGEIGSLGHRTIIYAWAVIALSTITLFAVVAVTIARPDKDNASIIATIIGVTSPASLAFTAMAVKEVYLAQNSRLTQLLNLTAVSSEAKGRLSSSSKNQKRRIGDNK
jgi:hypothetical protein